MSEATTFARNASAVSQGVLEHPSARRRPSRSNTRLRPRWRRFPARGDRPPGRTPPCITHGDRGRGRAIPSALYRSTAMRSRDPLHSSGRREQGRSSPRGSKFGTFALGALLACALLAGIIVAFAIVTIALSANAAYDLLPPEATTSCSSRPPSDREPPPAFSLSWGGMPPAPPGRQASPGPDRVRVTA